MQQEKRVLVVDDEPSIRAFVSRVLSRSGFVCSEASNAAETLASVMTSCPMLTITDIRMLGSDGTWLLAELKERCPNMPVIMLTGVSEAETAVQCLKAGAADYLVKPIEIDELVVSTQLALEKVQRVNEGRGH